MSISFDCPHCKTRIKVADKFVGRSGKCPQCQCPVTVPVEQDVKPVSPSRGQPVVQEIVEEKRVSQSDVPAAQGKRSKPNGRRSRTPRAGLPMGESLAADQSSKPAMFKSAVSNDLTDAPAAMKRPKSLAEDILNSFHGQIPRVHTSFLYRIAILLVAGAVLILPVLYLALIGLTIWGVYWHATENTGILGMGIGRGKLATALMYVAPIFAGVILVFFMLKPLFAGHRGSRKQVSLSRARQGLLFAFIDRLCDTVHSPRPARVELSFQANASASLGTGLLSVFRRQPVLMIGMPLVAGMTLQQFAGVVAHEFGHFSQGTGMRASQIVRTVNLWFARVVYQRDDWDEWLAAAAQETDMRIGIIFHFAQLAVFVSRAILWLFMMVSHALSCWLSRQMEFDADMHEIRLAGSSVFAQTSLRLFQINAGFPAFMNSQLFGRSAPSTGNPVRDLVAYCDSMDDSELARLQKRMLKSRTSWLDTHPADVERIQRAESEHAAGVFHSDLPAEALFSSFDELCHALMRA